MRPAFSVIFLTTLIGAAQGMYLVLYFTQLLAHLQGAEPLSAGFYVAGVAVILALCAGGLIASFFHLGHPERAWRAAAMWRTSWLSREVIALPAFMGTAFLYAAANYLGGDQAVTLAIGAAGVLLAFALFVCTGMIYAAVKVLKEWATPLTVVNFILLGAASGATLAALFAALAAPGYAAVYAIAALLFTLLATVGRIASLSRNSRLKPASTMQSAIGVRHPRIVQKSQGAMGGSYNTREFFHGQTPEFLRKIRASFLTLAFALPLLLLLVGISAPSAALLGVTFLLQYVGLLAERWFFFAEANHPQNLYYQTV